MENTATFKRKKALFNLGEPRGQSAPAQTAGGQGGPGVGTFRGAAPDKHPLRWVLLPGSLGGLPSPSEQMGDCRQPPARE